MINRDKLQRILEYAKQQRHIGLHCKVPPEDMVEIVEMAMFQGVEPVSNRDELPEGWVACSERMPSAGEKVLAYRPDAPESNDPLIKMATYVGGSAHGHGFDCYCKPTHWMPLPAAPQQEDIIC